MKQWFDCEGLSIINFPVEAEYDVLDHLRSVLGDSPQVLIHSKPISNASEQISLIDATGHEPTARTALQQRVSNYDNENLLENPADVQEVLTRFNKLAKSIQSKWWLWWSPSDMITLGLTDEEVARCLRILAKDLSKKSLVAFIAKDVHAPRGLAVLKYISTSFVDITPVSDNKKKGYRWSMIKHPTVSLKGDSFEIPR